MQSPRQLVKHAEYEVAAAQIFKTIWNADIALEGAEKEFCYADDLTIYPLVDEKVGLRAYKSDLVPVVEQVIIFFRIESLSDGERVHLYEVIKALRISLPWSDD
jgi:hypothetical protein